MQGDSYLSLLTDMTVASRAFRLGVEGEGSDALIRTIDQMITLLGALPESGMQAANGILLELLAAQGRKDFLLVADLLEFELAPLLRRQLRIKEQS